MSSGKQSSEGNREGVFAPPSDSDAPLESSLLTKVFENTLGVGESIEGLDGATRAAVVNFARQNGNETEISESLLGNLVQVVLRQEMALLAGQNGFSAISEQVAHSIWEDPAARGRISRVWRALRGESK